MIDHIVIHTIKTMRLGSAKQVSLASYYLVSSYAPFLGRVEAMEAR